MIHYYVNNKVVYLYTDGTSPYKPFAVVCTPQAGPSATFGTPVQVASSMSYQNKVIYDVASGKMVLYYKTYGSSHYVINAVVGTVSGTSISFGTPVVAYTATGSVWFDVVYNSTNNNHILAWGDDGGTGAAVIGTVSGTSISFGSAAIFRNGTCLTGGTPLSVTWDSGAQRIVVGYIDNASPNNVAYVSVGSISGTTITFGSATRLTDSGGSTVSGITLLTLAYDSYAARTFVALWKSGTGQWALDLTVSGTTASIGNRLALPASNYSMTAYGTIYSLNSIFLGGSINKILYTFNGYASLVQGYYVTTNATGWFGLATGTVTNGQSVGVTALGGINTNQSGLTANTVYYMSSTGTMTSASPGYGKVGVAVNSTSILITSPWYTP